MFTRENRIRYADVSGRTVNTETWGQVFFCTLQEIDVPTGQPVDRDIRDYVTEHLEEALENHWIQVYYQPVIRTLTGELCGLEALARWVDPQVGFLSPASFIPVLEQARLIHRLDAYVLEEVCRMLRERLDKNLCITPVSFNLSRYDFDSMDVFSVVENTRKKYSLPRDFLHVEITESTLAQNAQNISQALDQLREKGYEIWLDDFGSGYSSLNVLKDYQVDLIKLDMGFLRNFTAKSRSIIASVITMAKDLGVKTLVEGVETKEQADFLAAMGCGRMQGYFLANPSPWPVSWPIWMQRAAPWNPGNGSISTIWPAWSSARPTVPQRSSIWTKKVLFVFFSGTKFMRKRRKNWDTPSRISKPI